MKNFIQGLKTSQTFSSVKAEKYICDISTNVYGFRNIQNNLTIIFETTCDAKINELRSGIKVTKERLDIEGLGEQYFIVCTCREVDYEDDFEHLISNTIEWIAKGLDIISAIKFSINNWYSFLNEEKKIFSFSEMVGIIGELYILNKLLRQKKMEVLDSWVGPSSAEKDFMFKNGLELEIKSSCKNTKHIHQISSQNQLSPSDNKLFVISLAFKKIDTSGSNILDINDILKDIFLKTQENSNLYLTFLKKLKALKLDPNSVEEFPKLRLENELLILINSENCKDFQIDSKNSRISSLTYNYDFNGLNTKTWEDIYGNL